MNLITWQGLKLRRRVTRAICRKFFRDISMRVEDSVLIAGTGRSGTTWLSGVVASQMRSRVMFEPFHAHLVEAFRGFQYFHYMRPQEDNRELRSFCEKIFRGQIRHPWIDRQVEHLRPRRRIIKEIRANLFLRWIYDRFPSMPILFMVRHPCAVVLSRMTLRWATDTDIEPFLEQEKLVNDFLASKVKYIRNLKSEEEKHAVIWCISNLVPLAQFADAPLNVVFYENLCAIPEIEVPRVFSLIDQPYSSDILQRLRVPSSTTSRTSSILNGRDNITGWRDQLSNSQRERILSVVREFGLEHLYGRQMMPAIDNVGSRNGLPGYVAIN